MTDRPYNVLFLSTANSARSIIAEAILNKIGAGRFRGYSAGCQPKGQVHPQTSQLLASLGHDIAGLRSKSLAEFLDEPQFDFVLTLCDDVAIETPPTWPGQPTTAHWGIADPAEAKGTQAQVSLAFKEAYRMLNQRIGIFAALPLRSLDKLSLQKKVQEIGEMEGATRLPERS
jgi:arsenate reductase (thioredoxin)